MLSQAEADALFGMKKYQKGKKKFYLPPGGGKCVVPLVSANHRESFALDIRATRIMLTNKDGRGAKGAYHNREMRNYFGLARLDFGGQTHRNPDGQEVGTPHLHYYREGFDDHFAMPLPAEFSDTSDIWQLFVEFIRYCNIDENINVSNVSEALL